MLGYLAILLIPLTYLLAIRAFERALPLPRWIDRDGSTLKITDDTGTTHRVPEVRS